MKSLKAREYDRCGLGPGSGLRMQDRLLYLGYKQQHLLQRRADCKNVGHLYEIAKFFQETILQRIRLRDIDYIGVSYSGDALYLTHGSHHVKNREQLQYIKINAVTWAMCA